MYISHFQAILVHQKCSSIDPNTGTLFQYWPILGRSIIEKHKFQTKQNKALHNRTASAIHASVPCFPDVRSLLASDIRNWIDRVYLLRFCACIKLCTCICCIQISVFCLKFISLNNSIWDLKYTFSEIKNRLNKIQSATLGHLEKCGQKF